MKRLLMISAMAAASVIGGPLVTAQYNGADASGYFARGVAMYHDRNYNGCIDQLLQLRNLDADAAQKEDALYYMAMATQYCGDDEALDLLLDFLRRYPASTRTHDVKASIGDYYFTRGNYAEAMKAYGNVAPEGLTGDRAEDRAYRLAYSYMMLGEKNKARTLFGSLVGTDSYAGAANFYLAYLAYSDRDYSTALQLFGNVDTTTEPGNAAVYYMSQIYFMRNEYGRALELARKALDSDLQPEFTPELNRVAGESLYNLGRIDEALPYLRKYVDVADPVLPSAYYMLGVCEYTDANYAEAVRLLQKAVGPSDAMGQSAYLYLGQSYVKQGNVDGALMAFENAYRLNYDNRVSEAAFYNYIVARMDGGRVPFGNSVAMMEEFLKKYPESRHADDIRENLVSGYMSDKDYSKALRILRNIQNPSSRMLLAKQRTLFLIGTRCAQDEPQQALAYFDEALAVPGGASDIDRQCMLWAANCEFDIENYAGAVGKYRAYIGKAAADDPNLALAYYNLGYSRFNQSSFDDAFSDFDRAAKINGVGVDMRADCYNRMADCRYYQRDFSVAADYYKKAYDTNRRAGDYSLYQMAVMKGMARDYAGKLAGLDDVMSQFPNSALVPAALLEKAETYVAMGDTQKAMAVYSALVQKYPSTSYGRNGCLQLAITQLNAGNRQEAIEAYKTVVRNYPTSGEAQVAVDDLKKLYAEDGRLAEFARFVNSVPDAPRIDASQLDGIAFESAENDYIENQLTKRLKDYLRDFPQGVYEAQALYYLAEYSAGKGDNVMAVEYANTLLLRHPDAEVAEDAMLIKGVGLQAQGKMEMALDTYAELESRASTARNMQQARIGIMRTALELGRYDQVVAVTDKMMESTAEQGQKMEEVKLSRAIALDNVGRFSEAMDLWRGLASNPADIYGAQSAVLMGESLLRRGDAAAARTEIDAFINAGTPHNYWLARGFIVLSDALRAQGETFEADEYLKSLKNNYPGDEADIFRMIDERLPL